MAITYAVNGAGLDNGDKWWLLRSTLIAPGVTRSSIETVIPGMDGAMPAGYEATVSPTLSLKMKVKGTSDADLGVNLSAIVSVLGMNGRQGTVTRTVDGTARDVVGKLVSISEPVYSASQRAAVFTAVLRLPSVYWRDVSVDWSKTGAVSGTKYRALSLDGSSAAVSDALVLVTGPCSNPTVTDVATGGWCRLTLTLAAGEKALIDCGRWSVRRGSGVSFGGGGSVTSGSLSTSGGPYLLRLTPAMQGGDPLNTQVWLSLSGTGFTGATSLSVRARPAYLL